MASLSQKDFAAVARLSKQAIGKAVKRDRLHLTPEGLIDTERQETRDFLAHTSTQRRRAQRAAEEAFYATSRQIRAWWEAGALPEGWSYLALADERDARGRQEPVQFFSPGGRERIPLLADRAYAGRMTFDLENGRAIDADGTEHPLILRTCGHVPWLDKCTASERGRENEPEIRPPADSGRKNAQEAERAGRTVPDEVVHDAE